MTGKSRQDRVSYSGKKAINRHLYHHHKMEGWEFTSVVGTGATLEDRLRYHDEEHWRAKKSGEPLGHTHLPYQDGESYEDMANRMLGEGNAGEGTNIIVPETPLHPGE